MFISSRTASTGSSTDDAGRGGSIEWALVRPTQPGTDLATDPASDHVDTVASTLASIDLYGFPWLTHRLLPKLLCTRDDSV